MNEAGPLNRSQPARSPVAGHIRWTVAALLFFATTINYLDRQVLGVIAPELVKLLHWQPADVPAIAFWFQVAYAVGYLLCGLFLDLAGTRVGLAVAVAVWSLATAALGGVSSLLGFKLARVLLGLSEPAAIPAANKAAAEWFNVRERSLATGIYKAGSNLGAILVPLVVPWLFLHFGWRATFLATATTGFGWLACWLWLYRAPRESPRVSPAELALIEADPPPPAVVRLPWRAVLRHRETWGYMLIKFMTDAIWHWYGALFPLFLATRFKLELRDFGPPLIVVYLIANVGSIGGGWLSAHLMRRGWDVTRARKLAMFVCCLATLPVFVVGFSHNLWLVVVLVGVAHGAHQGLTSNLFPVVADLFPRAAVGTVIGLGGAAGQAGAALLSLLTAWLLATSGNYAVIFLLAGSVYVVSFGLFNLIVPRYAPVRLAS